MHRSRSGGDQLRKGRVVLSSVLPAELLPQRAKSRLRNATAHAASRLSAATTDVTDLAEWVAFYRAAFGAVLPRSSCVIDPSGNHMDLCQAEG